MAQKVEKDVEDLQRIAPQKDPASVDGQCIKPELILACDWNHPPVVVMQDNQEDGYSFQEGGVFACKGTDRNV